MGMWVRRLFIKCFIHRWRIGHGLTLITNSIGGIQRCRLLPVGNHVRLGMNWWSFNICGIELKLKTKPRILKQRTKMKEPEITTINELKIFIDGKLSKIHKDLEKEDKQDSSRQRKAKRTGLVGSFR